MATDESLITDVMGSLLRRTIHYFDAELGMPLAELSNGCKCTPDSLFLYDMTAIIGVGGNINFLVAFSFESGLVDAIYSRTIDDLDVPAEEEQLYRESVVAEIVNIIVGNSTADYQLQDNNISITPPIVLSMAKRIHRTKGAVFICRGLKTEFGHMCIDLVGPSELFDSNLDYVR